MPRARITLPEQVEYLSILDEHARLDAALDPRLSPHELQTLYRAMVLSRRFDERMIMLSRQGRIGNYPPFRGQEAASLGPAFAMQPEDWLAPSFRELPALLYRGWPMYRLMLGWWGGHEHGAQPPVGVNILPLCGPVAGQCLHAAGIAWGCKLKGRGVVVCFIGDGGTSEGDFHEAMNVAGAFRLPLVMVVQNNRWAISTPLARQTASATLVQKAVAYGFGGIQADGNDLLAMVSASREALDHARAGRGPMLIEALTYRLGPHSTSDNPKKYRNQEEVDLWEKREPLLRFRAFLESKGVVADATHALIQAEVDAEINEAVEAAERYQADPCEPFDHCFADRPDHLERQLAEFRRYLAAMGTPTVEPETRPAPAPVRREALEVRPLTPQPSIHR